MRAREGGRKGGKEGEEEGGGKEEEEARSRLRAAAVCHGQLISLACPQGAAALSTKPTCERALPMASIRSMVSSVAWVTTGIGLQVHNSPPQGT